MMKNINVLLLSTRRAFNFRRGRAPEDAHLISHAQEIDTMFI